MNAKLILERFFEIAGSEKVVYRRKEINYDGKIDILYDISIGESGIIYKETVKENQTVELVDDYISKKIITDLLNYTEKELIRISNP